MCHFYCFHIWSPYVHQRSAVAPALRWGRLGMYAEHRAPSQQVLIREVWADNRTSSRRPALAPRNRAHARTPREWLPYDRARAADPSLAARRARARAPPQSMRRWGTSARSSTATRAWLWSVSFPAARPRTSLRCELGTRCVRLDLTLALIPPPSRAVIRGRTPSSLAASLARSAPSAPAPNPTTRTFAATSTCST